MRILLILLCVNISAITFAQQTKETLRYPDKPPTLIAKFSPVHIVDFVNPTIHFALETRLTGPLYLQTEGGYIIGFDDEGFQDKRGMRLRGELRYYYLPVKRSLMNPFIGASFSYMQKSEDHSDAVVTGNGNFIQMMDFKFRVISRDYNLVTGFNLMADNRFSFEVALGLGYRWINSYIDAGDVSIDIESIDVNNDEWFDPVWEWNPGRYFEPDFYLGLKVGYIIF